MINRFKILLVGLVFFVASGVSAQQPVVTYEAELPYGANLFNQSVSSLREVDPNPNYVIAPGDKVDVKIWGAVNFEQVLTVDSDGNIFIPDVGPIKLAGVPQSSMNAVINEKVGGIYKDNVKIYTNLKGTNNISVFVTGAVVTPGRYMGDSRYGIIDYISRAGGIDLQRGSFRNIQILRNNNKLADFDIYQFLKEGITPSVTIHEGDTILVGQKGDTVKVSGDVTNNYIFEFSKDQNMTGEELVSLAYPKPSSTNVMINGIRGSLPFKQYRTIEQFRSEELKDGDEISFVSDNHSDKISITISGLHTGAKNMVLPLDAKLSEVLDNVSVHPDVSDVRSIYIRRKSVAASQKIAIQESLKKLQETILLAKTSGGTGASAITEGDAKVLDALIQKASVVEPEGRLVLAGTTDLSTISLEQGDEIVIPQKTEVITINGEVLIPQAIIWNEGLSVEDYIEKAGGFTDRANEDRIVVIRANGETAVGDGVTIFPGDEIMVLPEVKFNNLEVAGKVMDIIYKAAIAVAVPLRL